MNLPTLLALALVPSVAALAVLAARDPKRLRAVARGAGPQRPALGPRARAVLAAVTLVPGIGLAAAGAWAAFLIWMSGVLATGWGLTHVLAPRAGTPRA